jgi:monoterpene epsilon-lactone hydrolase
MRVSRRKFAGLLSAAAGSVATSSFAKGNLHPKGQTMIVAEGEKQKGVFVPARWITAPPTVSEEAQFFLNHPPVFLSSPYPDPADKAAWRIFLHEQNIATMKRVDGMEKLYPSTITEHKLSGTVNYEIVPADLNPAAESKVLYYVHGGGFIGGGGIVAALYALTTAASCRIRTFSIDYRLPVDHPFPTGLNDAVEGYEQLLKTYKPENIAIAGGSAGAGLAASLILKLRDMGLPMPACCALATPEADLTESGDTFNTNDTVDVVLHHRLTQSIAVYSDGHNLRDPYLSPLYGDFTKGFPPTIITAGTRDLFLSNAAMLHRKLRKAGIEADLHVFEAMPHGGFFGAPEDHEVQMEIASFINRKLGLA